MLQTRQSRRVASVFVLQCLYMYFQWAMFTSDFNLEVTSLPERKNVTLFQHCQIYAQSLYFYMETISISATFYWYLGFFHRLLQRSKRNFVQHLSFSCIKRNFASRSCNVGMEIRISFRKRQVHRARWIWLNRHFRLLYLAVIFTVSIFFPSQAKLNHPSHMHPSTKFFPP